MTKDKKNEVIICFPETGKAYIVTDPNNIGTYNYGDPDNISHNIKDVLPYIIFGNSPDDTTTIWERIWGN